MDGEGPEPCRQNRIKLGFSPPGSILAPGETIHEIGSIENCSTNLISIALLFIDHGEQRLTGKITAQIFREQVVMSLPQFVGQPCGMGSNQ